MQHSVRGHIPKRGAVVDALAEAIGLAKLASQGTHAGGELTPGLGAAEDLSGVDSLLLLEVLVDVSSRLEIELEQRKVVVALSGGVANIEQLADLLLSPPEIIEVSSDAHRS